MRLDPPTEDLPQHHVPSRPDRRPRTQRLLYSWGLVAAVFVTFSVVAAVTDVQHLPTPLGSIATVAIGVVFLALMQVALAEERRDEAARVELRHKADADGLWTELAAVKKDTHAMACLLKQLVAERNGHGHVSVGRVYVGHPVVDPYALEALERIDHRLRLVDEDTAGG